MRQVQGRHRLLLPVCHLLARLRLHRVPMGPRPREPVPPPRLLPLPRLEPGVWIGTRGSCPQVEGLTAKSAPRLSLHVAIRARPRPNAPWCRSYYAVLMARLAVPAPKRIIS